MNTLEYTVNSIDTDLSEKHLVAGCSDGALRIFGMDQSTASKITELSGHSSDVVRALFLNYGEIIASADFAGNLLLWRLENGVFANKFSKQISTSGNTINDIAVRYTNEQITVFCACDRGTLQTLRISPTSFTEIGEPSVEHERHSFGITSVSCNDTHFVTGGNDAKVYKDRKEQVAAHEGIVSSVAIAPENCLGKVIIASCSEDGKVIVSEEHDGNYERRCIEIGEPCHEVRWSKTGFVLSVSYGDTGVRSFMRGKDGDYEEVHIEKK